MPRAASLGKTRMCRTLRLLPHLWASASSPLALEPRLNPSNEQKTQTGSRSGRMVLNDGGSAFRRRSRHGDDAQQRGGTRGVGRALAARWAAAILARGSSPARPQSSGMTRKSETSKSPTGNADGVREEKSMVPREHGWVLEITGRLDRLKLRKQWPNFHDDGRGTIEGFIGSVGTNGGKEVEDGCGLVLRRGKGADRSLLAVLCSPAHDKFNLLGLSLLAEAVFHRACDDWETAVLAETDGGGDVQMRWAYTFNLDAFFAGSPVIPCEAAVLRNRLSMRASLRTSRGAKPAM